MFDEKKEKEYELSNGKKIYLTKNEIKQLKRNKEKASIGKSILKASIAVLCGASASAALAISGFPMSSVALATIAVGLAKGPIMEVVYQMQEKNREQKKK